MKNAERESSVGYLAWKLSNATRTLLESAVGERGLTVAQFCALGSIHDESSLSTADLARELSMTPQNMSLVVAKLEREGHVERHPHETNRRIQRLVLTERGRHALATAVLHARQVDAIMTADLCAAERLALPQLLRRCLGSLRVAGRQLAPSTRRGPAQVKKRPPFPRRKKRM